MPARRPFLSSTQSTEGAIAPFSLGMVRAGRAVYFFPTTSLLSTQELANDILAFFHKEKIARLRTTRLFANVTFVAWISTDNLQRFCFEQKGRAVFVDYEQ